MSVCVCERERVYCVCVRGVLCVCEGCTVCVCVCVRGLLCVNLECSLLQDIVDEKYVRI